MTKIGILRAFMWSALGLLTGCGTMEQGTIYSADGKVIPFQIERAYRTGAVSANDPSTGENFKGTYVGILERTTASASSFSNGQANFSGPNSSGTIVGSDSTVGNVTVGSNVANARAFFQGEKGTMLTCEMRIEAGIVPHGLGDCADNRGRKYKLQF